MGLSVWQQVWKQGVVPLFKKSIWRLIRTCFEACVQLQIDIALTTPLSTILATDTAYDWGSFGFVLPQSSVWLWIAIEYWFANYFCWNFVDGDVWISFGVSLPHHLPTIPTYYHTCYGYYDYDYDWGSFGFVLPQSSIWLWLRVFRWFYLNIVSEE